MFQETRTPEPKKLNYATHDADLRCVVADKDKNPQNGISVNSLFNESCQCVTFNAKIGSYDTPIVLDSGSGISIISSDLFSKVNRNSRNPPILTNRNIVAKSVTGEELLILGSTTVTLDLGDSCWMVECYVVSNFKYSCLLGTDFLTKSSATIDLGNLQACIGQTRIPISVVRKPQQVQVNLVESLEIPARSGAILKGSIEGLQGTVLLEPKYELFCKNESVVYPARSIASVENGTIPVKLVNTNNFPVKVFSDTCVGMAEIVDGKINGGQKVGESFNSDFKWLNDIDMSDSTLLGDERTRLISLLTEYEDVFVTKDIDLGRADRFSHRIDTGDTPPIRQRPYRTPHSQQEMVDKHIDSMLQTGIIKPSDSPWSQPLVIVPKKDGSPRFCVDLRKLNSVTKKQIFPMPRIDEVLVSLGDSCYFTTLDLASGYYQVPMDRGSLLRTHRRKGWCQT